MNQELSEYENEVVTHVLTYGYPSEDSDRWAVWQEMGIKHARRLAADTENALTEEDRAHRAGLR